MLPFAIGVVYGWSVEKVDAQYTLLHSFGDGTIFNDGAYPRGGLAQGPDGNLYGTTETKARFMNGGAGTIFQVTPSGVLTIILSFSHKQYMFSDQPLLNYKGTLVGATGGGPRRRGAGTLFALAKQARGQDWLLDIQYKFGANDAFSPNGSIIVGTDGNFYGVTDGSSGNPWARHDL